MDLDLCAQLLRNPGEHRVSLDIDVTIAKIHGPMMKRRNAENAANGNPTRYTARDITDYDWGCVNATWPQMKPHYNAVWLNGEVDLLASPQLLHELNSYIDVHLVTTKDDNVTADALSKWLKRHGLDSLNLNMLLNG